MVENNDAIGVIASFNTEGNITPIYFSPGIDSEPIKVTVRSKKELALLIEFECVYTEQKCEKNITLLYIKNDHIWLQYKRPD
jgi:hypothetical protein